MATAVQVESLWNGITDNNGQPLASGKVYTYYAGTSTPVSLYTASDKSSSATNPLILDAYGKAQVWADGRYKFVIKTSADVTISTLDNLLYGYDDSTLLWGAASTGSANAQVVSTIETVTAYANGQRVSFIAGYTNTGAATLQVNTLGAVNIVKGPSASSLQAGDIIAGQLVNCTYYGGAFRLEEYPSVADVQRSRLIYATNVSGTNAITADLTPSLLAYDAGLSVYFKAAATNTGAVTINLNGLGAKTIQYQGSALTSGEIQVNKWVHLIYDGTNFQILNVAGNATADFQPVTLNQAQAGIDIQNTNTVYSVSRFSADATAPFFQLQKSRGATVGSNVAVVNNDVLGIVKFNGNTGSGYVTAADIVSEVDGVVSGDMPGRIRFRLCPAGSTTLVEQMRITNAGYVGIGNIAPGVVLDIQRDANDTLTRARIYNPNAGSSTSAGITFGNNTNVSGASITLNSSTNTVNAGGNSLNIFNGLTAPIRMRAGGSGGVDLASTATSWAAVSDERFKKNIQPLNYGLAEITALNPIRFDYTEDASESSARIGFTAQSVQPLVPEAVAGSLETQLTLSTTELIPALVGAIKELNVKVEALEGRIAALEA
jgi:hypothetical protein